MIGTKAVCLPCGMEMELSRDGTQTATIKSLERWMDTHQGCRAKGDVVIRQSGGQ